MIKTLVHSFWTEPYRVSNYRINGGFKNKYYFLLSSVLSYHSFKEAMPNSVFELVTDDLGKTLLVDELGLEYDDVNLKLNDVKADSDVWSIGKLYAFQQRKPFLHVDFDAYLFKPLTEKFLTAKIVAANDESNYTIYNNIIAQLKSGVKVYDNVYKQAFHDFNQKQSVNSINMGVFGGTDIRTINEYAEKSLKMYDLNKKWLSKSNRSGLTCFVEQIYLRYYLQEKGIKPTFLLEGNWNNAKEHNEDAAEKGFTHLVSESKRNKEILNLLENRVKKDYPVYYEKLQKVKNQSIEIYDLKIK
jgi:hypothetical protein